MRLSTSTNLYAERSDGSHMDVMDSIRLCAQAGYEELDFGFVDQVFADAPIVGDHWREFLTEVGEYAHSLGLTFTQGHGALYDFCNSGSSISGEFHAEMVRRSVVGSQMLGIPWLVMHPMTKVTDGRLDPNTRRENIDFFRRLSDEAGKVGVGIAIENMWGKTREGIRHYAVDPDEFIDLVDSVDAQNVGACWDTDHGLLEGIDQPAVIRRLGDRLKALHISDATSRENIHILPYMGAIDWEPIFQALAQIGYDHPFTYELQHYLISMPLELCPQAIQLSYDVGMQMVDRIQAYQRP